MLLLCHSHEQLLDHPLTPHALAAAILPTIRAIPCLQNMSIVSALVLTLAITFHSSVTFDEFKSNDARYQRFGDDGVTPLGWRSVGDIKLNDGYASWWYGTGNEDEGGSQKGKTVTMTQQFNYNMVLSICMSAAWLGIAVSRASLLLRTCIGAGSSRSTAWCALLSVRLSRALIGRPMERE